MTGDGKRFGFWIARTLRQRSTAVVRRASSVLDWLPRHSARVNPSSWGNKLPKGLSDITGFKASLCARIAGLRDVRPDELRHTYASIALMHGETVLTIGRFLEARSSGDRSYEIGQLCRCGWPSEAVDTVSSVLGRL